jgi:hypothetical protein
LEWTPQHSVNGCCGLIRWVNFMRLNKELFTHRQCWLIWATFEELQVKKLKDALHTHIYAYIFLKLLKLKRPTHV